MKCTHFFLGCAGFPLPHPFGEQGFFLSILVSWTGLWGPGLPAQLLRGGAIALLSQHCIPSLSHKDAMRRTKYIWLRVLCGIMIEACAVTTKPHSSIHHVLVLCKVRKIVINMFLLPSYSAGFCSKKLVVCVFSAFDVSGSPIPVLLKNFQV